MNDPARVNTDVERLQAVTAADIQRVLRKYFSDTNRVVITYQTEGQKQNSTGAGGGARKEGRR